ncbi:Oxoglutarate/iron-dependent dioxygenase [Penicillium lividum]|nr:Oxoglutarate/iron-dependent dioxygenase [Penicillium lividum]
MPHEDGSAYHPVVATVSLGGPIVLDLYAKDSHDKNESHISNGSTHETPQFRILQERRSLFIMRGSIYMDFLHGIAETTKDDDLGPHSICNWNLLRERDSYNAGFYLRETRTSLTYRDVLKVSKVGDTLKRLVVTS